MIDPKFNEIEETDQTGVKKNVATGLTDNSAPAKPRPGLSINDTIAGDANLSVGSRGTDTSGVRAGAGAGAGSTFLTPGSSGGSPAPNVVPGPRGSGLTPLSNANPDETPTLQEGEGYTASSPSDFSDSGYSSGEQDFQLSNDEIASHAYNCWHERGCPQGSPEEDWQRAERELRERRRTLKSSTATA